MSVNNFDFTLAIGGEAGQGVATPGNILTRIFTRRGLHFYAYNAHQSIIRGGHSFLTFRVGSEQVKTHGDKFDLLIALNQDTMDRHLVHMKPGTWVLFNSDTIQPDKITEGVHFCPIPVNELSNNNRNKLIQNTAAIAAVLSILNLDVAEFEEILVRMFTRKGEEVVESNVSVARASYEYAKKNFTVNSQNVPNGSKPLGVWDGNVAMAMGAAAAGIKFYCAYPMSPATGILHWMARNSQELDIMVRQVEDEISVINMVIGASHAGCRSMCATSGGGFALMTEAIGAAGMMEIPLIIVNVQRGGPSTGLPTKTEQGDLWQALGASQGDFPRIIVAPVDALDGFNTIPELFNLTDKYQCPAIVLTDQLIAEGTFSFDPDDVDLHPEIDRGELITKSTQTDGYKRYKFTESGISPRALPGLEGYVHVVATDEHDEYGVLVSDEYTHPHKRQAMFEKRQRKIIGAEKEIDPPKLEGSDSAEVTLIGWGATYGVINEAVQQLNNKGISANHLHVKWIVPFHGEVITDILSKCNKTIMVENNYSGLFYRYMRSETGLDVDAHIRKYDGEPFMPHHVTDGVKEILANKTKLYVPVHEIFV